MNKEKQIRKMAKDICLVKQNCNDVCNPEDCCQALRYAVRAYDEGYRDRKEIVKEFVSRFEYNLKDATFTLGQRNDVEYALKKTIEEIK